MDSLITIPNNRLLTIAPKKAKLSDMLKCADDVLHRAVRGISDLITVPGLINVDFADVRTVMSVSGLAMMGAGIAVGEGRAIEAARKAITSPLLEDVSIAGAKAVLINITANEDLLFEEFNDASAYINDALGEARYQHHHRVRHRRECRGRDPHHRHRYGHRRQRRAEGRAGRAGQYGYRPGPSSARLSSRSSLPIPG